MNCMNDYEYEYTCYINLHFVWQDAVNFQFVLYRINWTLALTARPRSFHDGFDSVVSHGNLCITQTHTMPGMYTCDQKIYTSAYTTLIIHASPHEIRRLWHESICLPPNVRHISMRLYTNAVWDSDQRRLLPTAAYRASSKHQDYARARGNEEVTPQVALACF